MDQRKIQISEIETYNNKLTNIKSELESKLNEYTNQLNSLSNENAIEGAVKSQLDSFCSDIKTFLNTEVSQKLEAFTSLVKKDIEAAKATDSSTASKIGNILGTANSTSGPSLSNMVSGTAVNYMMNQANSAQAMGNAISQGMNNLDRMTGQAINSAAQGVQSAGKAIGNTATNAYNATAQGVQSAGKAIGNAATNAYNATAQGVQSAGKAIGNTATNAYNAAAQGVQGAYNNTVRFGDSIGKGIEAGFVAYNNNMHK